MTHYVKAMIAELAERLEEESLGEGAPGRFRVLVEELDRLDPRDFQPAHRFEFVGLRRRLRAYGELSQADWDFVTQQLDPENQSDSPTRMLRLLGHVELAEQNRMWAKGDAPAIWPMARGLLEGTRALLSQISGVLDHFVGPDVRSRVRQFPFIRHAGLRAIAERDYHELTLKLFPTESWKSVVILAGSVLEALLHDLLTRDPPRVAAALGAKRAPRKAGGAPRDITSDAAEDQWLLDHCIEVADELALLPPGWKAGVQAVLRDFRNYVHPRKELRAAEQITQGEAFQAVGALMRICDHIQKNHP